MKKTSGGGGIWSESCAEFFRYDDQINVLIFLCVTIIFLWTECLLQAAIPFYCNICVLCNDHVLLVISKKFKNWNKNFKMFLTSLCEGPFLFVIFLTIQ